VQFWYSRAYRALKQRASEPSQLMREYQHVCGLDYAISHDSSAAKSKAAAGRNRYTNVLPYNHNRVTVPARQVPYINASAVTYSHPSLAQPVSYIATQGPLPGTTADFWGMVLELQVGGVIGCVWGGGNHSRRGAELLVCTFPVWPHYVLVQTGSSKM
jgi:protein tyrosine phosphatase